MPKTTAGVKLDEVTRDRLRRLGEAKRRSPHWLMTEAIERYLETEERFERERAEDEARWKRYLETGEHVTSEEMMLLFDELEASALAAAEEAEARAE